MFSNIILKMMYETPLCEIMEKYGSDKGGSKNRTEHGHNYTIKYHEIFQHFRDSPINVFELGLGTNNLDVVGNMGANGKPGASLRGWKEYFPNAMVYGADIDKRILFQEDRIKTVFCDQTSPEIITNMWTTLGQTFDIIVDDGLHTFEPNKCFLDNSLPYLKPGGIYIIEDINNFDIHKWTYTLKQYPGLHGEVHTIPYAQNRGGDNNVAIIKKKHKT